MAHDAERADLEAGTYNLGLRHRHRNTHYNPEVQQEPNTTSPRWLQYTPQPTSHLRLMIPIIILEVLLLILKDHYITNGMEREAQRTHSVFVVTLLAWIVVIWRCCW